MAAAAFSPNNLIGSPHYQGPSLNGMRKIMDPEHLHVDNTYVIAMHMMGQDYQGVKVKYLERVNEEGGYKYKFEVLAALPGLPVGTKYTISIPDQEDVVYGFNIPSIAPGFGGGYRRRRKLTRRHRRGRKTTRRHRRGQ